MPRWVRSVRNNLDASRRKKMSTKADSVPKTSKVQEVCIDLPGESVQCWRSSDNIKVVLRKHRDVFFDIHLKAGASYTVESAHDFYSTKDKKLLKRATFQDGERFHLWVGREFRGTLLLKSGTKVISSFEPNKLDTKAYGADPKQKPEPLMVVLGKKELSEPLMCTRGDPFGVSNAQGLFKPMFDPKMSFLKEYGTEFDYQHTTQQPEIREYACVTEALPHEVQPQVLKQLDSGIAVEGTISQIFLQPKPDTKKSYLYTAMAAATGYIAGSEILTANWFKETAGYFQEHWRKMDKILMIARIEKKVNGKYRVLFKGRPLTRVMSRAYAAAAAAPLTSVISQSIGAAVATKAGHQRVPLGSTSSAFLDGGFGRTGKAGYGGVKRMMMTTAENFKGGLKIQIIGTIIDLVGDANAVYFDEKGSKDLSEFLGRAGVSVAKAGATAALGSAFAAIGAAFAITVLGATALPVVLAVGIVVAGYVLAATVVDQIDSYFNIKDSVADWAR